MSIARQITQQEPGELQAKDNTNTVDPDQPAAPDPWEAAKAAAHRGAQDRPRRPRRRYRSGSSRGRVEASGIEARPGDPLPDPVDRDPCPRCNIRADIGCRHRRAPLSMGGW